MTTPQPNTIQKKQSSITSETDIFVIMANKELGVGPTALRVRQRVTDVRRAQSLTLRQLSDRLDTLGWPLSVSVLSKIENGERRVDVDDLVALAVALDISVSSLLLPAAANSATVVFLTPNHALPMQQAWQWLTDRPSAPVPEGDEGRSASAASVRLTADDLEALARLGAPTRFDKGATLMRQGAQADEVLLLLHGRVKVVAIGDDGRESLLAIRGPNDLVGEVAALDGGRRSATVVALEPVLAIVVPIPIFLGLLRESPGASQAVQRVLAGQLRDAHRQRIRLDAFPTAVRLGRLLLDLADEHGQAADDGAVELDLALTQAEIAAAIGASRESVSRDLAVLRERGIIATRRRQIIIVDLSALRAFAEDGMS